MQDEEKLEESSTASPNETPEDKFKRIANLRVPNAIKKIKLIGNLSASAYKYRQSTGKICSSYRCASGV